MFIGIVVTFLSLIRGIARGILLFFLFHSSVWWAYYINYVAFFYLLVNNYVWFVGCVPVYLWFVQRNPLVSLHCHFVVLSDVCLYRLVSVGNPYLLHITQWKTTSTLSCRHRRCLFCVSILHSLITCLIVSSLCLPLHNLHRGETLNFFSTMLFILFAVSTCSCAAINILSLISFSGFLFLATFKFLISSLHLCSSSTECNDLFLKFLFLASRTSFLVFLLSRIHSSSIVFSSLSLLLSSITFSSTLFLSLHNFQH